MSISSLLLIWFALLILPNSPSHAMSQSRVNISSCFTAVWSTVVFIETSEQSMKWMMLAHEEIIEAQTVAHNYTTLIGIHSRKNTPKD